MNERFLGGEALLAGRVAHESIHDIVCHAYEAERLTIYRYLASLGSGPEVAQDLTQETFLKYYLALRNGERIQMPRAWLFRVASHQYLNWRRDEATRPRIQGDEASQVFDLLRDASADADDVLIRRQRLRAVAAAIQTLSPQQQICLRLRAEGLRHREIADILGVSVGTASEFVRRALARLKKVIDG